MMVLFLFEDMRWLGRNLQQYCREDVLVRVMECGGGCRKRGCLGEEEEEEKELFVVPESSEQEKLKTWWLEVIKGQVRSANEASAPSQPPRLHETLHTAGW